MSKMTVAEGRIITSEVHTILQKYADEKGLRLSMRMGFTYTDEMLQLKGVQLYKKVDGSTFVLTEEEKAYDAHAKMLDLPKRGTKFSSLHGDAYIIKHWKQRSRKYPIVASRVSDGANFKFTVEQIKRALSK